MINDGSISQEELIKAIQEHDTIIMLGHGTPDGLLAIDKKIGFLGYIIHDGHADLLKTKKTYSMWCHSDAYFERHGMKGFHSGMIISEEIEALMYGIEGYSDEEIVESLMPLMYAVARCFRENGIIYLAWPQAQTKPDGDTNRAVLDAGCIKILKIEQVQTDEKNKLVKGSEILVKEC